MNGREEEYAKSNTEKLKQEGFLPPDLFIFPLHEPFIHIVSAGSPEKAEEK